ncbi:MAG: lantibiotic dehydratase [Streptosporangiaceae bacterium]
MTTDISPDLPAGPGWRALSQGLVRAPAMALADAFDVLAEAEILVRASGGPGEAISIPAGSRFARAARVPSFRAALILASPSFAAAVDSCMEKGKWPRAVFQTTLRYLVRASSRPTPFGLFSGVALLPFGAAEPACLAVPHLSRARLAPDFAWLMAAERQRVGTVSAAKDDGGSLELRSNVLRVHGAGRVWLASPDVWGVRASRATSVRDTSAVRYVLDHARHPVARRELARQAAAAFPHVTAERVAALMDSLLSAGLLIPGRRPRLSYGSSGAARADARLPVPPAVHHAAEAVAEARLEHWASGPLPALLRSQQQVLPDFSGASVQADALLDASGRLPEEVARLAEKAAAVMELIGRSEPYPDTLREHVSFFTERYGSGAEVPLLDLLSDVTGIGSPSGYGVPGRNWELPETARTDGQLTQQSLTRHFARLSAIGLATGGPVELTMTELERIFPPAQDSRTAATALDITFAVGRRTDGSYYAVLGEQPVVPGGRVIARFAAAAGDGVLTYLRDVISAENKAIPDAVDAELTYLPIDAKGANIAERPLLREYELAVNVEPRATQTRQLALDDLLVGVEDGIYYLRSRSIGRPVLLRQTAMLNRMLAPDAVRFALEVCHTQYRTIKGFDWEAIQHAMPALPRVTCGPLVLETACWSMGSAPEFSEGFPALLDDFRSVLKQWRTTWRVPQLVQLSLGDARLLLDLDNEACVQELFRSWRPGSASPVLREFLPGAAECLLRNTGGQAVSSEVVVSVVQSPPARHRHAAGPMGVPDPRPVHWPGAEWLSLHLYLPFPAHNDLLIREVSRLRDLLAAMPGSGFFFLRYADPAPHLRLRVRIGPDQEHEQAWTVLRWAADLGDRRMVSDVQLRPYRPEYERYGGYETFAAVQDAFCADSLAIVEWLRQRPAATPDDLLLQAADFFGQASELWGMDAARQRALAREQAGPLAGGPEFRRLGPAAWRHWQEHAAAPLRDATNAEQAVLRMIGQLGGLTTGISPHAATGVLVSLLHMHGNRLGLPVGSEAAAYGVWRRVLDRAEHFARAGMGQAGGQERTSR